MEVAANMQRLQGRGTHQSMDETFLEEFLYATITGYIDWDGA